MRVPIIRLLPLVAFLAASMVQSCTWDEDGFGLVDLFAAKEGPHGSKMHLRGTMYRKPQNLADSSVGLVYRSGSDIQCCQSIHDQYSRPVDDKYWSIEKTGVDTVRLFYVHHSDSFMGCLHVPLFGADDNLSVGDHLRWQMVETVNGAWPEDPCPAQSGISEFKMTPETSPSFGPNAFTLSVEHNGEEFLLGGSSEHTYAAVILTPMDDKHRYVFAAASVSPESEHYPHEIYRFDNNMVDVCYAHFWPPAEWNKVQEPTLNDWGKCHLTLDEIEAMDLEADDITISVADLSVEDGHLNPLYKDQLASESTACTDPSKTSTPPPNTSTPPPTTATPPPEESGTQSEIIGGGDKGNSSDAKVPVNRTVALIAGLTLTVFGL
eukprot:Clim_evm29s153 gene=Clim_evmTU29s153